MAKSFGLSTFLILIAFSNLAFAGAINGSSSSNGSQIFCDVRTKTIDCSTTQKNQILNNCYVVIHNKKLEHCTWQSCGFISIVGRKPEFKLNPGSTTTGTLTEYGVKTAAEKKADWECNINLGQCLPKFPFARHYLTVQQALELRNGTDNSTVAQTLKSVPAEVIDANPYARCASAPTPDTVMRVNKVVGNNYTPSRQTTTGFLVHSSKVKTTCELMRMFKDQYGLQWREQHWCYSYDMSGNQGRLELKWDAAEK